MLQAGSCLVVYDSRGDTIDSLGPATLFAQKLVDLCLVPEVGRIAGGIKAFQELKTCLVEEQTGSSAERPDSMESMGSRLSGALTPKAPSLPQAFPESKRRSTPRWKVTIDTPQEVPPAMVVQGLYIGNKTHAANLETLQRIGITHILNVSRDDSRLFEKEITCKLTLLLVLRHRLFFYYRSFEETGEQRPGALCGGVRLLSLPRTSCESTIGRCPLRYKQSATSTRQLLPTAVHARREVGPPD
eukprot:760962-Hanusia_phi.AAC.6